jgi:hypothetical protein
MKDHSQTDDARPYSPLLCFLLLLTTGIVCAAAGSVI